MGALSHYATTQLQDLTLRGDAFSSPAAVYLGWFTTPASPDGTAVEVTGGGYARETIDFLAASDGSIVSDNPVTFTPLHNGAPQMITGWGVFDAATDGNLLAFGRTPSMLIPMGGPLLVQAGAIEIGSNDAAMTDYLANAWLDHLFRNDAYTPPANVYLGHYLTVPTATTAGTEVTSDGYDRQSADWSPATDGASALEAEVTWQPLATDDDLTLAGWALSDTNSAGNVLWFYEWPTPLDYTASDTITLPAGTITLQAA